MKIISRYVLREFFRVLAFTLMGLVFVFLVVDFLDRIDNFLEVHVPMARVAYYFLMSVPSVVFQLAPVAVLVSILISLGLLAQNSEVVAMKASGVSLVRLSRPIFFASLLIAGSVFFLSDTILPRSSAEVNAIWTIEVERQQDAASPIHHDVWFRKENLVLHFLRYDERARTIDGVTIYRMDKNFRLAERIEAQSALLAGGHWEFRDGLIKTYLPDGQVSVRRFEHDAIELPDMPQEFSHVQRSADEMSFAELTAWIRQMEVEGYDPQRYQVDLQLKIAFPFMCVIMALIGLPIAFWKEKGGGIALGIGVGIGLSFVYVVFLGLSRALGYSGLLPPLVAAWMPNLIFTLLGLFLFTHVRQ